MPISTDILAPVTALMLLTCVVWAWMYITRIPAIQKLGMKMDPNLPKGQQMSELPPRVRWKADNYNHLLEQPTMFYAVALTLALLGAGEGLNVTLAWCYVGYADYSYLASDPVEQDRGALCPVFSILTGTDRHGTARRRRDLGRLIQRFVQGLAPKGYRAFSGVV